MLADLIRKSSRFIGYVAQLWSMVPYRMCGHYDECVPTVSE